MSILARSIKSYKRAIKPLRTIKRLKEANRKMAAGFKIQTKTHQATIARLERKLKKAGIDIDSDEE